MKGGELGQRGDSRACGEEDEWGINGMDGDNPRPSQETIVPNLDIR
jgi:hypothetical protein